MLTGYRDDKDQQKDWRVKQEETQEDVVSWKLRNISSGSDHLCPVK